MAKLGFGMYADVHLYQIPDDYIHWVLRVVVADCLIGVFDMRTYQKL